MQCNFDITNMVMFKMKLSFVYVVLDNLQTKDKA